MVRHKNTPLKKFKQVTLLPNGDSVDAALQRFVDAAPAMQAEVNKRAGGRKKRPGRRKKKRYTTPQFVINKSDEALIKEAEGLQDRYRRKLTTPRRKRVKRAGKVATKPICFNKRTTLLSLLRKIPDAKKPLTQWLK